METIIVDGDDREIGYINVNLDTTVSAFVPRAPIAQFLLEAHEVRGQNEQYNQQVSCIQPMGSKVKFIFVSPDVAPDDVRSIVKALLTEAASLHAERERARSRRSHPSSGGLVMDGPDRHPKAKRRPRIGHNVPPMVGKPRKGID